MTTIERLLDPDSIVVFDGAMGTMLYSRGVFINQCYDELNLRAPELVRDIHRQYVNAGAEVLETNSFGANRTKLTQHGLQDQVKELNRAAARVAREAANDRVLVAGAVGPLGVRLEPYGPTSKDEACTIFREQMEGLAEGGVDLFILETFGDLEEIEQAIRAARLVDATKPVIAQMTIGSDYRTPYGASPDAVVRALDAWGADVIGLNCSVGPQTILECIEKMVPLTRRKLSAQPNAGMPRDVGGRSMYMASPEYMATYARHLVQAGAKIVGGCCGTTPDHIHAMVEGIRPLAPRLAHVGVKHVEAGGPTPGVAPTAERRPSAAEAVPFGERSRWAGKLARGEFVSSVEIVPPRGVDASRMLTDTRRLKEAGVDAVNVPDGPRAQSRMGALLTSVLIEQQVGIETVTHYACRDRNLLGMLSDLLGAAAVGLRNLLVVTGDPPKMGPYPDATAVFDVDSIGLTNLVSHLNRGLDPGGNAIGKPTCFAIGVGVNPVAIDLEQELKRFHWKVDAGAEFAITQPVFDAAQLEKFFKRVGDSHIPVVAGIWPLVSVRNAEFLANEVPGVSVPDDVIARMRRANEKSKEHAVAEGIAIAREMLDRVRPLVQGVQVSAPFGKIELALDVFANSLTAPQVLADPAARPVNA
ncbi:MAG TPA: bifunctional homocysteine S-methyltransferase/methylenetetrahydrofolate reductase [Gemmatimonadaceae bacterium]|jgi:homocysteine S-methyltransferase|nr:bifunctional homocysteine S-methyltransferase/methylenetetrahydrofolate reductase [Gemmatimonadaceae bacterium]